MPDLFSISASITNYENLLKKYKEITIPDELDDKKIFEHYFIEKKNGSKDKKKFLS